MMKTATSEREREGWREKKIWVNTCKMLSSENSTIRIPSISLTTSLCVCLLRAGCRLLNDFACSMHDNHPFFPTLKRTVEHMSILHQPRHRSKVRTWLLYALRNEHVYLFVCLTHKHSNDECGINLCAISVTIFFLLFGLLLLLSACSFFIHIWWIFTDAASIKFVYSQFWGKLLFTSLRHSLWSIIRNSLSDDDRR